jgi:hypothetical protein
MEEETLTLTLTLVLHPEPNLSAQDKEAFMRGAVLDHVGTFVANYDWGITVDGTLESTNADTVLIADSKPDYEF